MLHNRLFSVLVVVATATHATAFIGGPQPIAGIKDIAKTLQGLQLDVQLAVGRKDDKTAYYIPSSKTVKSGAMFPLRGFQFELLPDPVTSGTPSAFGKTHPSSGACQIKVVEKPSFIGMMGAEKVTMENGSWELLWRDTQSYGFLVCSFDVPKEVTRNDATLPAGRVHMMHHVWSAEGLADAQERKARISEKAREHMHKRDEEADKYRNTNNPLAKAWHFRNVMAAHEEYFSSGITMTKHIPDEARQVLNLPTGFAMSAAGQVLGDGASSGSKNGFANLLNSNKGKSHVGTTTMSQTVVQQVIEEADVVEETTQATA